ncbi:MAG: hypothetical protein ABSE76_03760 [Minisyncoccia bacterium]|jgi:hypothetical protein
MADLNLGIQTFVGTTPMSQAVIDTSAPATYHVYYVVTDANNLTSTSTRTVIILPAQAGQAANNNTEASTTAANDNLPAQAGQASSTPVGDNGEASSTTATSTTAQ